ncbi:MAG: hydrogenase [Desulfovibrionaceae bacterium]|jgi:hydrogenase-4 component F|nr:hydrogenase [Desulfovibrionaceae bacterium]
MLLALILLPLAGAALALALPRPRARAWLLPACGAAHLALCVLVLRTPPQATPWLGLDALARLVLPVTSVLFLACALYAVDYLHLPTGRFTPFNRGSDRVMVPCLLLFLAAMTLAVAARHLGLLWIAVEATTIVSAPLISHNRNAFSIEATWKYLLICSVGIALAMLGLLFTAYAALGPGEQATLQFDALLRQAPQLSRPWLRAGFVFLLVGFGTKMGLAPLHTWKPDAYGEAPGLVGALLAGGLTSVACLAILRGVQLMAGAGDGPLARHALLALGLLSLVLAAAFMVRQPDIKRLLAYSSVEHMGILAVGVGVGGLAAYGAMLHLVNNALTKGSLFLAAGNIQRAYASKRLSEVRGAMAALPVSGGLFLAGFLAITGSPPFGPFLSEFTILRGMFGAGSHAVAALVLAVLAVVFLGMGATVLQAVQGEPPTLCEEFRNGCRDSLLLAAPPLVLLLLVLGLGLWLPEPLQRALRDAAALLEVTP